MSGPGLPEDLLRSDRDELKEVVREFLYRYSFLHEKRVHKLVFYGEVYCLQNYGRRLSDADFKPYHYGPYAELITDTLHELSQKPSVKFEVDGDKTRYMSTEPGKLSEEKREIIAEIDAETRGMSTQELVQFSKTTWLWKETEEDTLMDFETYLTEQVLDDETRETVAETTDSRRPADTETVEQLLSV